LLHGWMDVSASFQFLVDAMQGNWRIVAPDWRGFGLTDRPAADCYWFPDYLADLDELLRQMAGEAPVDLVAHSMGGNVAMLYAGTRPERVRRLVNLEGVGLRDAPADEAPRRYEAWLDALQRGARLRDYADLGEVAARMMRSNPRLSVDKAAFLAQHWSQPTAEGRRELLGDPAHRIVNAVLYRADEVLACWRRIAAPVLLVLAGESEAHRAFLREAAFQRRLQAVTRLEQTVLEEAGHMLHHDRPQALAALLEAFLDRTAALAVPSPGAP
jgi:pimeloyl-ACP methyl ester carboxylesterase